MVFVEVDERVARTLEFAARMANITAGQVVARLIDEVSLPTPEPVAGEVSPADTRVAVHVNYDGFLTRARYDPATSRIDIIDGPLAGTSYKSPTGAARAVVGHYKPNVSPHRNGWSFWSLDDGSGRLLQAIRYRDA